MADTITVSLDRIERTGKIACIYVEAYMYHNPIGTVLERLRRYSDRELKERGFRQFKFEGDLKAGEGKFSAHFNDSMICAEEIRNGREAYFEIISADDESQHFAKEVLEELLSCGEIVRLELDPFNTK